MIRALGNVAGRHLLDKRLNPLPELRDAALAGGAVPLRIVRRVGVTRATPFKSGGWSPASPC